MHWWNAALLFALFAGHCELMAAWVNRVHALPWPKPRLRRLRAFHDLLLVGFPPLVLWRVGLDGPEPLTGGEWSRLTPGWTVYFALCGLGILSLVVCSVRNLAARQPEVRRSDRVDVTAKLGFSPVGTGWKARIARLPGNEALSLEVNEKEYVLSSLPPGLDGLSIAHISDVHFRGPVGLDYFRYAFARVAEMRADLVAFTGDLLDEPELFSWVPETFGRLSAPLGCWFILGNHDWLTGAEPIRRALTAAGWVDVGSQAVLLDHRGLRISIAGDETPWLGSPPDLASVAAADFRLLLSHTPDHVRRAARDGADLMLAGHNHGGQVRLPIIGPVYSPSRYGVRYASGSFRAARPNPARGPLVLHVSRGLSAERPLRWNCLPEVTRIVLRAADRPSDAATDA